MDQIWTGSTIAIIIVAVIAWRVHQGRGPQ